MYVLTKTIFEPHDTNEVTVEALSESIDILKNSIKTDKVWIGNEIELYDNKTGISTIYIIEEFIVMT